MSNKANKKSTLTIKGVYTIEDGKILMVIEDVDEPIDFAAVSVEYVDKEVTISITQNTEIV